MLRLFGRDLIGIDLGSYSLKVVWLKRGHGSYALKFAASFKLTPEAAAKGGTTLAFSGFLSNVVSGRGITGRRAAVLISGRSLIFRQMYLPVMPEADLREAVKWELKKEGAIPAPDFVCDYCHASTDGKAAANIYPVIAFAAKKTDVESLLALYKTSGVDVRVVDAAPTALLFAFDANNLWEGGVNYGVVDIGCEKSTLVVLKDKKIAFVREIAFGGSDITHAIAETLGKDDTEAEEFKIANGLRGGEGQADRVAKAASGALERFAMELHRSFDFYQAQFRGGPVSKLFLSGSTAMITGIDAFIAEAIGIPAFIDDPLRKVKTAHKRAKEAAPAVAPPLTIALGMAIRMDAPP